MGLLLTLNEKKKECAQGGEVEGRPNAAKRRQSENTEQHRGLAPRLCTNNPNSFVLQAQVHNTFYCCCRTLHKIQVLFFFGFFDLLFCCSKPAQGT
jgi:hypothetical protein